MHRDEQSAWQAGSYSFLTPASAEWCNRKAGPLSSSSPASPSLSPLCTLPRSLLMSIFLPSLLFLAHSLSSLFSFLSLSPSFLYSYSLAPSLSPSVSLSFPEAHVSLLALHTITSIHQLSAYSSLATPLPFLYSMTTTPTIQHTHVSLRPPSLTSHPSGQLSVPPHTLVLLPLLLLSLPPKLTPPVAPHHTRCPLSLGEGVHVWRGQEQKDRMVGLGGKRMGGCGGSSEWAEPSCPGLSACTQ